VLKVVGEALALWLLAFALPILVLLIVASCFRGP
jgi:hypothetical protein